MIVADVIKKYHTLVPFPWTTAKIRKAGHKPAEFLIGIGREIEQCQDATSETAKALITMLNELDLLC